MLTNDGMINVRHADGTSESRPGAILAKWLLVRKTVGNIDKVQKPGMKFKTLSAETVIDKVASVCNDEGILIYPISIQGEGHVVEDGTLADVTQTFRVQAIEDGSYIHIAGFGLGADSQDKAGGKAGTYAMKAALAQALMANGSEKRGGYKAPDTDDTDEPIKGGVRPKKAKANGSAAVVVQAAFVNATTEADYKAAVVMAKQLSPEDQLSIRDFVTQAKARVTTQDIPF